MFTSATSPAKAPISKSPVTLRPCTTICDCIMWFMVPSLFTTMPETSQQQSRPELLSCTLHCFESQVSPQSHKRMEHLRLRSPKARNTPLGQAQFPGVAVDGLLGRPQFLCRSHFATRWDGILPHYKHHNTPHL